MASICYINHENDLFLCLSLRRPQMQAKEITSIEERTQGVLALALIM